MTRKNRQQERRPSQRQTQTVALPSRYEKGPYRVVKAFVEGYDDVAFWRNILDDFETDRLKFEINVPPRDDLAKGKKVLLSMIDQCSDEYILCMDSDFDYLFNDFNEQSRQVNHTPHLFHTFAYATENYLCYPPSLHRICVKATKNDTLIFDFERFMSAYSRTIYPLFLWYAYSARTQSEKVFTLFDFRSSVRLNYLDLHNDGIETLQWLGRQVDKRRRSLEEQHPDWIGPIETFGRQIERFGVKSDNVYFFMQGHTLLDNVVLIVLNAVCERLRDMTIERITQSTKQGLSLKNELSNYNNSLRNVREVLLDNEQYKECFLYQQLRQQIEAYVRRMESRHP